MAERLQAVERKIEIKHIDEGDYRKGESRINEPARKERLLFIGQTRSSTKEQSGSHVKIK